MKRTNIATYLTFLILIPPMLFINSCTTLGELGRSVINEPSVSYKSMKFNEMNFDQVGLLFDFEISNPNAIGIKATGFDYSFAIDGNEFLTGRNANGFEIAGRSTSPMQIPVSLGFNEILKTGSSIIRNDSISYTIQSSIQFDVPVLGIVNVPVESSGQLPVPRLPTVSVEGFSIKNISISGAELLLRLKWFNPNSFGITLGNLNYNLDVQGNRWASATVANRSTLASKDEKIIEIPIRLDFVSLGSGVYRMLTGGGAMPYSVSGNAKLDVDLPYFEKGLDIPLNLNGSWSW